MPNLAKQGYVVAAVCAQSFIVGLGLHVVLCTLMHLQRASRLNARRHCLNQFEWKRV